MKNIRKIGFLGSIIKPLLMMRNYVFEKQFCDAEFL